jgi:ATP-dependent Zn protease
MYDPTESQRREMTHQINAVEGSRADLEAKHGQVWDTTQLQQEFEVLSFMAPFVVVRRRSDRAMGSVMFQTNPRFYFEFKAD